MANYVIDRELMGKPKEKYWISYIKGRIRKNKNFLGFISGQTGSGKSYSTIRVCEELDPEFNIDRVCFSGLELMALINSGKLKRGSSICFEEAGVSMSNKNWQSTTNKMLNYLLQTFRHRGFVLIMNSPYMDFVDASTRKLFHAEMQTTGIDFKSKQVYLKAQLIQYNSRLKKFYYKRLKVIKAEGKLPVNIWKVDKPSKKLLEAYEQKKREYTDKLNKKIHEELQGIENKGKKKDLTEVQEEILELIKQGMNVEQMAAVKDRSISAIKFSMRFMKNKGYQFKPVFDEITHRKVVRYDIISPNSEEK